MEAGQKLKLDSQKGTAILIQSRSVKYRSKNPVSKQDIAKATMSDEFIQQKSSKEAYDKFNNSLITKAERGAIFIGIPAALSITHGAMTEGAKTLGKVKSALNAAKFIGVGIAGIFGAKKAIDIAAEKAPKIKEFAKENPGTAAAGTLATILGGALIANPVVNAVGKLLGKTPAPGNKNIGSIVTTFANNQVKKLKGTRAETIIEKKVFQPVKKFFTENTVGKKMSKYATPLFLGGAAALFLTDMMRANHYRKKAEQNLLNEREQAQQKFGVNPFKKENQLQSKEINRLLLIPDDKNIKA